MSRVLPAGFLIATLAFFASPANAQRPLKPQPTTGQAVARTVNDTYALRQELGNDSYVWEPMLKRGLPTSAPSPSLVNPAGQSGHAYGVRQASAAEESVMRYYGKRPPAARPPAPRRFVATAQHAAPVEGRPFDQVTSRPTVSAYMDLFREQFVEEAPNYHAYVRPQLEQRETLRRQQVQLERLERRTQGLSPSAPRISTGGVNRFGNTGQFFGTQTR